MPLMTWNDTLSVGVAEIDTDHKKLIQLVNELFDAMLAQKGKDVLGKTLDGLIAYTAQHFAREERLFARTDYPGAAAHKTTHLSLVKQVLEIQQKYNAGHTATLSIEVMNFLKSWLANHINGDDRKACQYLNSKGVH